MSNIIYIDLPLYSIATPPLKNKIKNNIIVIPFKIFPPLHTSFLYASMKNIIDIIVNNTNIIMETEPNPNKYFFAGSIGAFAGCSGVEDIIVSK